MLSDKAKMTVVARQGECNTSTFCNPNRKGLPYTLSYVTVPLITKRDEQLILMR